MALCSWSCRVSQPGPFLLPAFMDPYLTLGAGKVDQVAPPLLTLFLPCAGLAQHMASEWCLGRLSSFSRN